MFWLSHAFKGNAGGGGGTVYYNGLFTKHFYQQPAISFFNNICLFSPFGVFFLFLLSAQAPKSILKDACGSFIPIIIEAQFWTLVGIEKNVLQSRFTRLLLSLLSLISWFSGLPAEGRFCWLFIGRSSADWAAFPSAHPALLSSPSSNNSRSPSSENDFCWTTLQLSPINIKDICISPEEETYWREGSRGGLSVKRQVSESVKEEASFKKKKIRQLVWSLLTHQMRHLEFQLCGEWTVGQQHEWHPHCGQTSVRVAVG